MKPSWPSRLLCMLAGAGLAVACGGSPSAPSSASPTILRQGTLTLGQTYTADLETGAVAVGASGADIWFEAVTLDERYLTPQNGARLRGAGWEAPGFSRCLAAGGGLTGIPMQSLAPGVYLCAVTKHGHIAEVRVDQAPAAFTTGGPLPLLVLSFATYNN